MKEFQSKNREKVQKHLEKNWDYYNFFDDNAGQTKECPMILDLCQRYKCASWIDAEVVACNYPLKAEKQEWKIEKGRCQNPFITGIIRVIK